MFFKAVPLISLASTLSTFVAAELCVPEVAMRCAPGSLRDMVSVERHVFVTKHH